MTPTKDIGRIDQKDGEYASGWMPWHRRRSRTEIVDEAIRNLRADLTALTDQREGEL